jgi:ABC-type multidrug transport system ATPase subunit
MMKDAVKSYGGRDVLTIGSYALNPGDRAQIVGANGSGKSTFLRLLAGIAIPNRGSVIRSDGMRTMSIGFVPQEGGFHGDLSLRKNAGILTAVIGGRGPSIENREELFEEFRLTPFLDKPVHTLSDGMRRLALVASILQARPHILLIDEPFSGIDGELGPRLEELLLRASKSLEAVLVTGHSGRDGFAGWPVVAVGNQRI